jgi:integrase
MGENGLSNRSLSQALSAVRSFHRFLDLRLDAPCPAIALVRGPKVRPDPPRPVSEDQARGLIQQAGINPMRDEWETLRDTAVLTLLWGCGLRISEALSLKNKDAPLGDSLRITGKGGKTRLSPVFPFALLNYAFGITQVKLGHFVLASWLGMMPGTVLYVYLGSLAQAAAGERTRTTGEWALYVVGLLATIAVTVMLTRVARRALAPRIN